MFSNLFAGVFGAGASYKGSELERLILSRVQELGGGTPNPALVAQALAREHPRLLYKADNAPALSPELEQQTWSGLGSCVVSLVGIGVGAARMYGDSIDGLKAQNSLAALALANCLIQYVDAADIPFKNSESGYRRYFSAYLVLRKSLALFDMLGPLQKHIAGSIDQADFRQHMLGLLSDSSTDGYMIVAPVAEQQITKQVLAGLEQFRSTMRLIPGPIALGSLQQALTAPQTMMTRQWSQQTRGGIPRPTGTATCTFCGGSGKSGSCGGCNGKGHVSRLSIRGEVEITSCLVCAGMSRARCDMCMGTGKQ